MYVLSSLYNCTVKSRDTLPILSSTRRQYVLERTNVLKRCDCSIDWYMLRNVQNMKPVLNLTGFSFCNFVNSTQRVTFKIREWTIKCNKASVLFCYHFFIYHQDVFYRSSCSFISFDCLSGKYMSRDMWFPTMRHFDKCRLRRACAAF